jgi:hypothetical protein
MKRPIGFYVGQAVAVVFSALLILGVLGLLILGVAWVWTTVGEVL